jgi:hypothetical protein
VKRSKPLQNAMMTPDGFIINSRETHDYQEHDGYFVDGGLDNYTRYGCPPGCKDKFEPLFLYENDDFQTKKEKLVWGTYGKDGKQPLRWVKFIDCEDDHLKAILKIHISDLYKKVINTILEERVLKFRKQKLKKILKNV